MAVIGTGLMGASLGLAVKKAFPHIHTYGVDKRPQALQEARALGAIEAAVGLEEAARADLVCLAMPMGHLPEVLSGLGPKLKEALWMDIGSSKQNVLAQVEAFFGALPPHYVPCHPMAGGEASGASAARADLYEGSKVLIIPHAGLKAKARKAITTLWQALGAETVEMTAKEHDEAVALTSHLPHLLAYTLADALDDSPHLRASMGPGFFSLMRLAKSNPALWGDICMGNRNALQEALNRYQHALGRMQEALEAGGEHLLKLLENAHKKRHQW